MDATALLTPRLHREVRRHWGALQAARVWSESSPVLLLDRCWLRLSVPTLAALPHHLPPDTSAEAPELVRYRDLRANGLEAWQAQQLCWEEFGAEACRQAQWRLWQAQERGNRGWTLERYLALRADYRQRWERERPRPVPLLVLAREDAATVPSQEHQLLWLCPGADEPERPMRHTCA
ncbi:MAG: hypothetical protein ACK55X_13455 [Synechococcaceae cyanobacterium]|jgi:hypothetical protein